MATQLRIDANFSHVRLAMHAQRPTERSEATHAASFCVCLADGLAAILVIRCCILKQWELQGNSVPGATGT